MSSPEYLRRHYGVVSPTGETPRFSIPENLARRTAEKVGIYETHPVDIPIKPKPKTEAPPPNIITVQDPNIGGGITWTKRQASGTRTIKKADLFVVSEQEPNVFIVPKEQTEE